MSEKSPLKWDKKEKWFIFSIFFLVVVTIVANNVYYFSSADSYRVARERFYALSPSDQQYYRAMYAYAEANQTEYDRLLHHSSLLNYISKTRYFHQAMGLYQQLAASGNTNAVLNIWKMTKGPATDLTNTVSLSNSGQNTNHATIMDNVIAAEHGNIHAMLALESMYHKSGLNIAAYTWSLITHQESGGKYAPLNANMISQQDLAKAKQNAQVLLQYISPPGK